MFAVLSFSELLDLTPLAITALNNPNYEMLYKFSHFNPVQVICSFVHWNSVFNMFGISMLCSVIVEDIAV